MSSNKSFSTETSERYSRALFEVTKEFNELDKTESDIKNFQSLIKISPEVKNFLKDPTQSIDQQNKAINLLSEKFNFSKNLKNFFLLLIEKRRIFFVEKISESFLKLCLKKRGEIKASLISSKELSQSDLDKINKELSQSMGATLKFDYVVDKNLIGGLKLQLGSFMIDTSIKNKSEDLLKNELILREKNNLPPFIRLIAIIISSKDRSLRLQGAREIKLKLNQINNLEVLGPVDSPL